VAYVRAPERQGLRANKGVARHYSLEMKARLAPDQRTVKRPPRQAMADNDGSDQVRVPFYWLILAQGRMPVSSRLIVNGDPPCAE
jgi:hypothetical protein